MHFQLQHIAQSKIWVNSCTIPTKYQFVPTYKKNHVTFKKQYISLYTPVKEHPLIVKLFFIGIKYAYTTPRPVLKLRIKM